MRRAYARGLRILFLALVFAFITPHAFAENDPGHDTLYIEENGNSELTGSLNVTNDVRIEDTVDVVNLQLKGSTISTSTNRMYVNSGNLYIESPNNIYFNDVIGNTNTIYIGGSGDSVDLSVTGDLTQGGVAVCLANGTNCAGGNNTGNVSSIIAGDGISVNQATGEVTVTLASGSGGDGLAYASGVLSVNTGTGLTTSGDNVQIDATVCTTANGLCDSSGSSAGWSNTSLTTSTDLNVNVTTGDVFVSSGKFMLNTQDTTYDVNIYGDSLLAGSTYVDYGHKDLSVGSRGGLYFTTSGYVASAFMGIYYTDSLKLLVDSGNGADNNLVFGPLAHVGSDFDHSAQTNPTLWVHSNTDPDSDNAQWMSFAHDQTDGVISTGTGDLKLSPAGEVNVVGNLGATGYVNATIDVCVAGGACLSSVASSAGGWTDGGTEVYLTTATDNVSVDTDVLFVDTANDRVGIGTNSPSAGLDVRNGDVYIFGASDRRFLVGDSPSAGQWGGFRWDTSTDTISFGHSASDSNVQDIVVDGTGKVGINDSTPSMTLDVTGNIGISGTEVISSGGTWTGTEVAVAKGGTGATTADGALTNLAAAKAGDCAAGTVVMNTTSSGVECVAVGSGDGSVTSVGLSLPSEFSISGSPVTTSGTLTGSWASATQNYIFAAPSGSSGTPSFRALVDADIPNAITVSGGTIGSNSISSGSTWTTTGTLTIGDGGDRIDIASDTWDVTNGAITGLTGLTVASGTVSLPNSQIDSAEINSVAWTKLDTYPTACGAGEAIQAVGDTLTCVAIGGGSMDQWQLTADSGGTATIVNNTLVDIAGGTGITTARSSNTVTITNSDLGSSQNIFKTVSGNTGSLTADSNSDTLTLSGAGITNIVCSETGDTCTMTSTEVDGSTSNEINTITADSGGSTTGLGITLAGGGIVATSRSGDTVTITGTETDPQVGTVTNNQVCFGDGSGNIQCTTATSGSGNVVLVTSPTITTPTLTLSTSASTTSGRISYDATGDRIGVGDGGATDYFYSGGTMTSGQWCTYDGTEIDCNVAPVSDTDAKVGVDSGATPDYLGAAYNNGALQTTTELSYADGGNYITLGIADDAVGATELADTLDLDAVLAINNQDVNFDSNTLFVDVSEDKVGIGTATPNASLHIQSGSPVVVPNANANTLVVESSTTGGINILTPDASNGFLMFGSASDNGAAYVQWNTDSDLLSIETNNGGADIAFGTGVSGAEVMRLLDSGFVGIGTSSPGEELEVVGDINATRLCIGTECRDAWPTGEGVSQAAGWTNATGVVYTTNSGDDVGIGTGSPQSPLHIYRASNLEMLRIASTTENDNDVAGITFGGATTVGGRQKAGITFLHGGTGSGTYGKGDLLFLMDDAEDNNEVAVTDEKMRLTQAGKFGIGVSAPVQDLEVSGNFNATGNIYYGGNLVGYGADLAEMFASSDELEPGDIVVIDTDADEAVKKSSKPYDTLVAGIVSTDPSHTLGAGQGNVPLALAGRVPVKVTTRNGPIKRGDLLTTSDMPGRAMRCESAQWCAGAIIGKALEEIENGDGMITALVTLQ